MSEWGLAAVFEAATIALKDGEDAGYVIGQVRNAMVAWERANGTTVLTGAAAVRATEILERRLPARSVSDKDRT